MLRDLLPGELLPGPGRPSASKNASEELREPEDLARRKERKPPLQRSVVALRNENTSRDDYNLQQTRTPIHADAHARSCTHAYSYISMYIYIYMHTHLHQHLSIPLHTHTHIHTHAHIYTIYMYECINTKHHPIHEER